VGAQGRAVRLAVVAEACRRALAGMRAGLGRAEVRRPARLDKSRRRSAMFGRVGVRVGSGWTGPGRAVAPRMPARRGSPK
jgi:hypothetical protein